MTKLADFIAEKILNPRLDKHGAVVVYDPDRRYTDICLAMKSEKTIIVDASGSSIEGRTHALRALTAITDPVGNAKRLLVYVPRGRPASEEERQTDPFANIAAAGAAFPEGDGDEYLSLCLRFKPDHSDEIHRVFSSDVNPPMTVIDAIGKTAGWPVLENTLGTTNTTDILLAFLHPSADQKKKLNTSHAWNEEAVQLLMKTVGMKWMVSTFETLQAKLWQFLLFSEFVFDLPEDLPGSLTDVPRAGDAAMQIVMDLCERLREDRRYRDVYMEQAEKIESELKLPRHCQNITDLGQRDTFPFEERSFLLAAAASIDTDDQDLVSSLIERHSHSIWVERAENQAQWAVVKAGAALVRAYKELDPYAAEVKTSGSALVLAYAARFRELDKLHREFEQACAEIAPGPPFLEPIVAAARSGYRNLSGKIQEMFIRTVEQNGWPIAGFQYNADMFDKLIAPELAQAGNRTAMILVDALRFELAVELEKQIQELFPSELHPACAVLPTITPVGMASLLPGAGLTLQIRKTAKGPVPELDGKPLPDINARLQVLKDRYGTRFHENRVRDFINSKKDVPKEIDFLLLRSSTIDTYLEAEPELSLSAILEALRQIKAVLGRLSDLGFKTCVIATDHGFCIAPSPDAGDVCPKPTGDWDMVHDRLMLGAGSGDSSNFILEANDLGIRGDYPKAAGPKALVPYRTGLTYFHGGLSLQECVVPVMSVKLAKRQKEVPMVKIKISYKSGTKVLRTRVPVIHISAEAENLFTEGTTFEVLLEARDKKGKLVAQAVPGGAVNAATGTVTIRPGDTVGIPIRIDIDFQGQFNLKALDPKSLIAYDSIELETDFSV